ncbi:MAG: Arginine deiminase [candidate division TM6 bacterium GW2011_GWF2_32_72]|nr:MAG: Arginine deiminase [candidate division TM6 bacterium GW2011_GWF2_32_72]
MKNLICLQKNVLLSICFLLSAPLFCSYNAGVKAEWNTAKTILMHTPGDELFCGILHPDAALFEGPFDMYAAINDLKNYITILKQNDIDVILIEDILLEGTINENGSKKEGQALDDLINLAKHSLTYTMPSEWSLTEREEQEEYLDSVLKKSHPKSLLKIIFEKPTIDLKYSPERNTRFIAKYESAPLFNLHFCRDQQITTDKGVVLGKMNSIQRNLEVDIMEFVFNKLGATPIYRVTGKGRLEGGDFIPAGDFALLGQGLRTNEEGVRQLLENNVFDFPEIAIVKDPFQHQDQMHLDTYFNIIGNGLALVDTIRRETGFVTRGNVTRKIRPSVDVYQKRSCGAYECTQKDVDFFDYIEKQKGFKIIDIQDSEQLNYGCNFLCIGDRKIVAVQGVSETYEQRLLNAGVDLQTVDFRNLTKSYGGPHCTTQVLKRTSY